MDQPPPQLPAPPSLPQPPDIPAAPDETEIIEPEPCEDGEVPDPQERCNCDEVHKYATLGASVADIANYLKISPRSIMLYCERQYRHGIAFYHLMLRQWQKDSAQDGRVTMLIHLGKTELGQGTNQPDTVPFPQPALGPKVG